MSNQEYFHAPTRQEPSKYVLEYRPLVSWAYRRAAWPVHTPAITQHLAFWFPSTVKADERKKNFDLFTKHILSQQGLSCTCEIPSDEDHDEHSNSDTRNERHRYQTYRLAKDDWHGLPVKISLEKHQEYLTVTTVIELACLGNGDQCSTLGADLKLSIDRIESILRTQYTEVIGRLFSRDKRDAGNALDDRKGAYQSIFINVWEQFYKEFLQEPVAKMGYAFRETDSPNGTIFADFRGFIVSCSAEGGPFFLKNHLSLEHTRSVRVFSKEESTRRARAILPFMTAETSNAVAAAQEREITLSRFLNGRCIYASTLGAQPPESTGPEQPLTYFALTTNVDSWQSGRLVDRVQTLGTLRLAARRHLGKLRQAADELHGLEINDLKDINIEVSKMIADDKAIDKTRNDLVRATTKMEDIRREVEGGLPYRVERSRYYRSQFKSLVSALRIGDEGRIEGFQPYHEFVERRFGSAYDFIDMVGTRFSRLEQQLSATNQRMRTADTARLQKTINAQTGRIKKFQDIAEKGFFLALFPYYVGKVIAEGLYPAILHLYDNRAIPPETDPKVLAWSIAGAEIVGIAFLVYLRLRNGENE